VARKIPSNSRKGTIDSDDTPQSINDAGKKKDIASGAPCARRGSCPSRENEGKERMSQAFRPLAPVGKMEESRRRGAGKKAGREGKGPHPRRQIM